jgi:hypothetical protein
LALDTRLETAVSIEPDEGAPVLGAARDEERGYRYLPKDDDAAEAQERHAEARLMLDLDADGIMVEMQDRACVWT